jgi:peroxiredoxin
MLILRRTLLAAGLLAVSAGGYLAYHWLAPEPQPDPHSKGFSPFLTPESSTIPASIPEFVLNDVDNKPRSVTDWKGKSLVLNFWATWCEPCRREIPLLKAIHAERSAEGFQVLGVAIDHLEEVAAFAKANGMEYPLLVGEHDAMEVADSLGVSTGIPFTVFADSQGRIVSVKIGELKAEETTATLSAVKALNEGDITLAQAQGQIAERTGRQR